MISVRRTIAAAVALGVAALVPVAADAASAATASAAAPAGASFVSRVNARWTSVVDASGNTWAGRSGFEGPANRSDGLAGADVAGTADDVLYRSNLFGATAYRLPVPAGDYRVRLLMAEDYHRVAGGRVFDVYAEGAPVLRGVDIAGAVGFHAAYDRSFTVHVADGRLDLDFVASRDKALISAIEVVGLPPAPGGSSQFDPTPSPGPGAATTSPAPVPTVDPTPTQAPTTNPTPAPTTATPTAAPTSTPKPAAPSATLTGSADVAGGGRQPVLTDGVYTMSAGAGDSRSEVFWASSDGGRYRLAQGTTVTAQFQVRHDLNDPVTGAKPSPKTWHTIFQFHGPTKAGGTWPGPPVTIAWQDGTYRIGGGAAVPNSSGALENHGSWFRPYAAAPNNVWRTFKVTAYLDGPGRGWLSIWIDGKPYMDHWKPAAGTMYTDSENYSHKEISIKSGLYTGTDSPSWLRWVQERGMQITVGTGESARTAVLQ